MAAVTAEHLSKSLNLPWNSRPPCFRTLGVHNRLVLKSFGTGDISTGSAHQTRLPELRCQLPFGSRDNNSRDLRGSKWPSLLARVSGSSPGSRRGRGSGARSAVADAHDPPALLDEQFTQAFRPAAGTRRIQSLAVVERGWKRGIRVAVE